MLKEAYLPLCRVNLPTKIYRGIEQAVKICILKRSKNCRPLANPEPLVRITPPALHKSLDAVVKRGDSSRPDNWIATFIPAYKGWHQLTVKLGSLNVHSITTTRFEVVSQHKSKKPEW